MVCNLSKRKRINAAAAAVAVAALIPATVDAFVTPGTGNRLHVHTTTFPKTIVSPRPTNIVVSSSTMENPTASIGSEGSGGGDAGTRTTLDVRIHGVWYDLTRWRKAHPAGDHWLDWYDGRDATEVMDGFHSHKARKMYARLPKSKPETVEKLEAKVAPDSKIQIAFRKLFDQLEADGWWKRDINHERKLLGMWGSLVLGSLFLSRTLPVISTTLLTLSFTAAGWLGHDYIHGIDPFADKFRNFAAFAAGLLPVWWSDKHNKHHAVTNEKGCDEDVATDPFLYQWAPAPENDSPIRRIQHWIFYIPFSFLFALWRFDSIKASIAHVKKGRPGSKSGLRALAIHYAVMVGLFPLRVWLPAIFVSGLLSALIVTPTHQSEEMFDEYQSDWVTAQFQSTRSAVMSNPFSEWLWGGMQYQLEHHLFPSMPRSKYPALRHVLMKFAEDNKVPGGYRESGEFEILKMNWDLYRKVAKEDAVAGSLSTQGFIGQQGGIMDSALNPAHP
eukprot:CAMPEP_0197178522 /NCGR_PEP_ID=MMETSP1423-20130617/3773_1 /TAXON_ID=476441 /ORGANISM="Pseudo-nitzschia heimii, Strain UNC1101" /LENGTH=500 /DNA_ID=CAMNT_0042628283 /DNA_START=1343 /DNA_END=2845 /DNA_ORIENTATION=-